MDFPTFHLDFFGNRMLIAAIAVLHVFINHALAVGAIPVIVGMEWWGHRKGDAAWDALAYKTLFVCFIITTTVGAMTGVGIWFSASLVNPYAIASLIRVFFWAWFTEWFVFVSEVCFILAYFLLWKRWSGQRKVTHIRLGAALCVFSWLTMAIIVAILGFMMDPGNWESQRTFWNGVLNPLYAPQLLFRTPLAMVSAGLFVWFLVIFFTQRGSEVRAGAIRFVSAWVLAWTPLLMFGAIWYRWRIPESMLGNLPVAMGTQRYETWYDGLLLAIAAAIVLVLAVAGLGLLRPGWMPRVGLVLPFCLVLVMLGEFERVREFIRKPYVINEYMYANGVRTDDLALFQRDGLLAHCAYASTRTITPENRISAGRDVFLLACTRCHTTTGVNGIVAKFENLYGRDKAWDRDAMVAFIENMHGARPFMPPFPGNRQELEAMTDYILQVRKTGESLEGAQVTGVEFPAGDGAVTKGGATSSAR
ncbi:MAG: c-type cytochrome [Phycisphaerae bacterium]|nr:c-type cytochrome [Phycisphaerae bacterium]